MMVRLDEVVKSKENVQALKIETGDFISIEPKFTVTPSGFIKTRYLDDKAGTACALSLMELFKRLNTKPKNKVNTNFFVASLNKSSKVKCFFMLLNDNQTKIANYFQKKKLNRRSIKLL